MDDQRSAQFSQTYLFPGCPVRIDSDDRGELDSISRMYCHLIRDVTPPREATFTIRSRSGKRSISRIGRGEALEVDAASCMAHLEHEVGMHLIETVTGRLLLHAAAVARGDQAVLLPGDSGAGKTTLSATLTELGCGYVSEELAVIDVGTKRIAPVPRAFSIKGGSFERFERFGPEARGLEPADTHYLDPEALRPGCVVDAELSIGWVVFPRFVPGSDCRLQPLTPAETVVALFEQTVNISRQKQAGVDALIEIARIAPGSRLMFGDVEEASRMILHLRAGGSHRGP